VVSGWFSFYALPNAHRSFILLRSFVFCRFFGLQHNSVLKMETTTSDIVVDSVAMEKDQFQKLGGFINLGNYGMMNRNINEIVKSIFDGNAKENVPIFIFKDNKSTLRLICANEKCRDVLVESGLCIFKTKVMVEKPRPPRRLKTVYLYGLPIFEKPEKIELFLKTRLKAEIKSEFRWTCYPGTEIRNGGRSVSIETPVDVDIPGFLDYASDSHQKPRKISIWYPDLPIYCRICYEKGHASDDCRKNRREVTESTRYANAIKSGKMPAPVNLNTSTFSGESDEVLMTTLSSQVPISKRLNPSTQTTTSAEASFTEKVSNIFPFYTKTDVFSNHYECDFEIDGVEYRSTEQYLFAERAKVKDKMEIMEKIMRNRSARIAKQLGEQEVPWEESVEEWRDFAGKKLTVANRAKYTQNDELRQLLFKTAPKVLAEASPSDTYWGVGLRKNDPQIHKASLWKGENAMGKILMNIRDELMSDPLYVDELSSDWTVVKNPKRQLTTPEDKVSKRFSTL
jgi:ribA/ribD-fused uncharacterized protein